MQKTEAIIFLCLIVIKIPLMAFETRTTGVQHRKQLMKN
jgi:hypothetical protein